MGFVQRGRQIVPVVAEVHFVEGDDGHARHAEATAKAVRLSQFVLGEEAVTVEYAEFDHYFDYVSYEFFCFGFVVRL